MYKMTTEEFISKSIGVHGNKYDYSLVEYKGSLSKVKIFCKKHGEFYLRSSHHLNGHGCKKCSDEKIKYNSLTNEEFIKKSIDVHGDLYNYSLTEYKSTHRNVKIICSKHGVFHQLPSNHLRKIGCPKCSGNKKSNKIEFVEISKNIHINKYDYSLVEYKNNNTKVKIICPKHGIFLQTPTIHIRGCGCPLCKTSKGENKIKIILDKYKINNVRQFTFDGCKDKMKLPFDFFLPEHNLCIEFDGKQHFKQIKRFGGEEGFKIIKKHDDIKNNFCENNNIKLLRIKYDEDLNEKLKFLNENKI